VVERSSELPLPAGSWLSTGHRPLAWLRRAEAATAGAIASALLMGVPTDVVPNPWFTRMTPVRPLDVVLLGATSIVLGLLAATYVRGTHAGGGGRAVAGGGLTGIAIACPICNKAVVALVGTSGAVSWFGPIQPLLGAAGFGLALWALYLRLRGVRGCDVRGTGQKQAMQCSSPHRAREVD
jgi:hypothetical protein